MATKIWIANGVNLTNLSLTSSFYQMCWQRPELELGLIGLIDFIRTSEISSYFLSIKLPSTDRSLGEGLWPKIPVNIGGSLRDPAMSEPTPMMDAPADISADWKKETMLLVVCS